MCYLIAMLAKESAVVLPAILVLIDVVQGEALATYARKWWREAGALTLTLALVAAVSLLGILVNKVAPLE